MNANESEPTDNKPINRKESEVWRNFRCRVCYCGPIFGWCVYRGSAQMTIRNVRQGPMARKDAEKICRRLNGEEVAI